MKTYKYKNMMFFAPDEGGGEGGGGDGGSAAGDGGLTRGEAAFEPAPKTTTGERSLPTKTGEGSGPSGAGTGEGEGGEEKKVETPPAGGFDASKFAKEFGDVLGTTLKPVLERAEPQVKLTPEQARKELNFWEPDENWYKSFDNLETRADAVQQMRDGLVKQADTIAQYRLREAIEGLKSEIMPHLESVREAADNARDQRFQSTYPQLAKPELKPLVDAIAQDLIKQGKKFNTESEAFKALASGVEAVIRVNNPEFKLETTTNGSGQSTEGRGGRQLPVTSPGGGGGTGRREGGNEPPVKRGLAIFGK